MSTRPSDHPIRIVLALLLILSAGAYLRLFEIGSTPPGLYRDEAFYGLDALNILHGKFALFFAANNGREGLFIYLLSIGIALFGRTPEALRIVSASVGIATIAAIYFTGRQLFSTRIGLLSAGILAVTFWHVAISRVAFRAITLPLLLCVTVALWAASRTNSHPRRRRLLGVLAGATFGMTFYTYTSGQFLIVLVLAWVIWHRLMHRRTINTDPFAQFVPVRLYMAGAAATLLPFVLWLLRHSDLYLARAGQVSILNPVINQGNLIGTLMAHISTAALMFTHTGDRIWRHNLSLRPVFDGPLALAFVIGVGVCAWATIKQFSMRNAELGKIPTPARALSQFAIRNSQFLILCWLVIFLIPTILAEDTPHFLRAIGALPAACLITAVGLEAGLAWLSRRGWLMMMGRLSRRISPPALIATLVITYSGYGTYQTYFNDYAQKPITGYWLEQQNVVLAHDINTWLQQRPDTLWLQDRLSNDNAALQFLSPAIDTSQVHIFHLADDHTPLQLPGELSGLILLDPNHPWGAIRATLPKTALRLSIHEGALAQGDLDSKPHQAYIGLLVAPVTATSAPIATFQPNIVLAATRWITTQHPIGRANQYTLEIDWQITAAPLQDYSVFVHWRRGNQVLTQSDHSPTVGHWPMPEWRMGDVIVDKHVLILPGSPEAGDEILIGMYDPATGKRLAATTRSVTVTQDWVIIPPPR